MRRAGLIVLLLLVVAPLVFSIPPVFAAKRTWTVVAGGEINDAAIVSNFFHPRDIDSGVGDTVTWKFPTNHTVTFVSGQDRPPVNFIEGGKVYRNPAVFFRAGGDTYDGTGYRNSGLLRAPETYSLTLTKAGKYEYFCIVHPGMSGTVTVRERPLGTPVGAERRGRSEQAATLQAGQAAWATWEPERQAGTVTAIMVGDPAAGFSFLRFTKQPLIINTGTSVTWVNRDSFRPHTVTVPGAGEPIPDLDILEPQREGPPRLLFNPKVSTPTPSRPYEGGYANSAVLPAGSGATFTLTFSKAGQYEYVCMIHAGVGMKGTVIVR